MKKRKSVRGFTFIEVLVVVAIIGLLTVGALPSILNSLEVRRLESETRAIQTAFQQAKILAVREKVLVRIRFVQDATTNVWTYSMERQNNAGAWTRVLGFTPRDIDSKLAATITLPLETVHHTPNIEFSSIGMVSNYDSARNGVTLQSLKLADLNKESRRNLTVYEGGSFEYSKST